MSSKAFTGDIGGTGISLSFHVADHLEIGQRPSMPRFIPGGVIVSG